MGCVEGLTFIKEQGETKSNCWLSCIIVDHEKTGIHRDLIIENLAKEKRTVVIYESPHRILKTLNQFLTYFETKRRKSVVRELSHIHI